MEHEFTQFYRGGLALQDARALSAHRGLGKRQRWTGGDPADLLSVFLWRLRVLQLLGSAASTAVYCFDSWPMQARLRLLRLTAGSVGRAKRGCFARRRALSFKDGSVRLRAIQSTPLKRRWARRGAPITKSTSSADLLGPTTGYLQACRPDNLMPLGIADSAWPSA